MLQQTSRMFLHQYTRFLCSNQTWKLQLKSSWPNYENKSPSSNNLSVSLLSAQLKNADAGAEKYLKEVRRRQVNVFTQAQEIERSKEGIFDRSIVDEASKGVLVVLNASIGQLKVELDDARVYEKQAREETNKLKVYVGGEETELHGFKAEVGAQWGYAEKADEKIKSLEGEKRGLTKIVQAMDATLEELHSHWKAAGAKRVELKDESNEV
ncbi:hypothetical protein BU17DRAFT_62621 [Hysterangium stoloniferum]|nr:hypothetical protein BU17DRAFT_62621 [Hysterangium stoloniferum]